MNRAPLSPIADYMAEARNVFRNPGTTEFVIVTIPTAMAAAESIRLAKALQKEQASVVIMLRCGEMCVNGVCASQRGAAEGAGKQLLARGLSVHAGCCWMLLRLPGCHADCHLPLHLTCLLQVPIRTLVVNQVLPHGLQDKYLQVCDVPAGTQQHA